MICNRDIFTIDIHLNLILEAFADSNYFLKQTSELLEPNVDIEYRVKAVSEFFGLEKPTATEAERLVLYACSAHILAKEQADEIANLKNRLQKEKELNNQRENSIQALKKQCEQFQNQLTEARQQLEEMQGELETERNLYERLNQSSKIETVQAKNALLRQVEKRIKHELQILERCLNGSGESFQANSQIGLQNIEKIRKSLFLEEE